jgi:FkbM family methyltransferase
MLDFLRKKLILLIDQFVNISYSQEGEDLILKRFFNNKPLGFYIDIGAHHPKRFSNTNLFYQMGWRGINIDAMPGSMRSFLKSRPRDLNIEAAISDKEHKLTYFMFNEPALNGFDEQLSNRRNNDLDTRFVIKNKIDITTQTLKDLLDKQEELSETQIDFMSVDVEGLDLEVLRSNDWNKYRPQIVLVEVLKFEDFGNDEIVQFLLGVGYKFYAKSHFTVFFIDANNC